MRMDIAQGIWGLDDALRDNDRPGFQNLFSRKDTSFLLHVDWAFLQFSPEVLDHWFDSLARRGADRGPKLLRDRPELLRRVLACLLGSVGICAGRRGDSLGEAIHVPVPNPPPAGRT